MDVSVRDISFMSAGKPITVLSLSLGERVELNGYVHITPANAKNKKFTVESADAEIVKIETAAQNGVIARVTAVATGVGETTLTAVSDDGGKTATMKVRVSFAEPSEIRIVPRGDATVIGNTMILRESALGPVELTARLSEGVDPAYSVTWSANGKEQTIPADTAYTFAPQGIGSSEITARVTDVAGRTFADSMYVNVYSSVTGTDIRHVSGKLEQNADAYETVRLQMGYDPLPEGNPLPIFEWFVNGAARGTGQTLDFLPDSPGVYVITGQINGTDAGAEVRVRVRGKIVPQNVWLDYDDCYPKVWIRWDTISAAAGYEISLINRNTGREVSPDITTRNTALQGLFTDSGFDATQYLTGNYNVFNTQFSVRVKTLPDADGVLAESDWSAEYTSPLVPRGAESYLNSTFYDGARNRYVKSYEEFYEWFEYAMLWRPSTLTEGEKLFLDYSFTSAIDVIQTAMEAMHFTGDYGYGGKEDQRDRRICTFRITFETDGAPSMRTQSIHTREAWNALRPHINYDRAAVRPSGTVFPIDSRVPVTVTTSDQLYYTAQLGYKPVPVSGSAADKLYAYARRTLRYIIRDDMTDVEKVHAIYDWIMWRVIYDEDVLGISSVDEAVKYEAYYLESVFTDSYYYGVCDAMSKAFVLMTNIEGIRSLRVTGSAYSGGLRGGHAWNKVQIDGEWYVCDCTWGDFTVQLMRGGAAREAASHAYFLVTDADIADTHTEDEHGSFPATAKTRYPWYDDVTIAVGEFETDIHLESSLGVRVQAEIQRLVSYMTSLAEQTDPSYNVGENGRTSSPYLAFEIVADAIYGTMMDATGLFGRMLSSAFANLGLKRNADYYLAETEMGGKTHGFVFLRLSD